MLMRPLIALSFSATALLSTPLYAAELAYVPNEGSANISVIDLGTHKVVKTLPAEGSLGKKIQGIALDKAGKRLFVVDAEGDSISAIDLASGKVSTQPAGKGPEGIERSPDGKWIAVCAESSNEALLFDAASFKLSKRIPMQGENPEHCVFSPDGKWLVAGNEDTHDIDVIDLTKGKSVKLIKVDGAARGMGFTPEIGRAVQQECRDRSRMPSSA
eukprot:TRINITY_DN7768_c0_g2_i2.p2 TRINITY_DN7768_c0_g2~~TRINITY_DN7768_c0_g2_i2.p2  ORF type:complete len:215 (+),score=65.98 TRINITY_DN7768_c0_g2_i2:101-745(+)